MPDRLKIVSTLFSLTGAVVAIITARALEGNDRRAFLLNLRIRLLNRDLEKITMTDPLTGLGNRRLLEDQTRRFWTEAPTGGSLASVILIDVDHFKAFNDSYGHPEGDSCLAAIAGCVGEVTQDSSGVAVRFGGEELLVFLPHTGSARARCIAEIIRQAVCAKAIPHAKAGPTDVVTASFGVATALTCDHTPAELVKMADAALYSAKHNGRNQVWPPSERPSIASETDERRVA